MTRSEGSPLAALATHRVLLRDDPAFPKSLLVVRPQPEALYAMGDLSVLEPPAVAIVGSRTPSLYGIRVAYEAAYQAARAGLAVVSGLARGLDARAHQGALDAGGKTIAVLGSGIDVCYPQENGRLYDAVRRSGLLLSEMPPGTRPYPWSFPARNRIIAGLARCLLVVEGRAQGGTSNTAWWMLQLGRSVLAVPGRISDSVASGPNTLIRDGARPYLGPQDLLDEFGLRWAASKPEQEEDAAAGESLAELGGAEAAVFELMTPEPAHVDYLVQRTALEPGMLLAALASLELQGLITQLPGKHFALAS